MSKGNSGLFCGTVGANEAVLCQGQGIIASRVKGLDLREHPRENSLSAKRRKLIKEKIDNRTATKSEYYQYMSHKRFSERRKTGVNEFWKQERRRIREGKATTREWSDAQKATILSGLRPKYNGKTIQGHHTYSASRYPHLANRGEVVFPVTFDEHLYGWHGGNFKKSLPGKPVSYHKKYNFRRKKYDR